MHSLIVPFAFLLDSDIWSPWRHWLYYWVNQTLSSDEKQNHSLASSFKQGSLYRYTENRNINNPSGLKYYYSSGISPLLLHWLFANATDLMIMLIILLTQLLSLSSTVSAFSAVDSHFFYVSHMQISQEI